MRIQKTKCYSKRNSGYKWGTQVRRLTHGDKGRSQDREDTIKYPEGWN